MIKLETGISTNMDFIKAMKERGQDVNAEFPAETLRDQFDALSEEKKITFESTNEDILEVVNEEEPTPTPTIELVSAERMDVSGATQYDNPGIVENGDKYTVSKEGNTITVVDEGLIAYVGGNIDEPKKWVGILVDLGEKVTGVEYNIEDVDYEDAGRWGASNDTTFIMWLTTEKGGEYTFNGVEDPEASITLTVTFTEEE